MIVVIQGRPILSSNVGRQRWRSGSPPYHNNRRSCDASSLGKSSPQATTQYPHEDWQRDIDEEQVQVIAVLVYRVFQETEHRFKEKVRVIAHNSQLFGKSAIRYCSLPFQRRSPGLTSLFSNDYLIFGTGTPCSFQLVTVPVLFLSTAGASTKTVFSGLRSRRLPFSQRDHGQLLVHERAKERQRMQVSQFGFGQARAGR